MMANSGRDFRVASNNGCISHNYGGPKVDNAIIHFFVIIENENFF